MAALLWREFKVLHPQSSAGAGARWSDRRSARRATREGSSESNRTSFHEWGAASLVESRYDLIRVFLLSLTQLLPLGWFAGFPNPLLLRSCLSAVFLDLPQVLDSSFGPTIGCSTSCPPRHSVVVQIISAWAARRAEEDLSVPGELRKIPAVTESC